MCSKPAVGSCGADVLPTRFGHTLFR